MPYIGTNSNSFSGSKKNKQIFVARDKLSWSFVCMKNKTSVLSCSTLTQCLGVYCHGGTTSQRAFRASVRPYHCCPMKTSKSASTLLEVGYFSSKINTWNKELSGSCSSKENILEFPGIPPEWKVKPCRVGSGAASLLRQSELAAWIAWSSRGSIREGQITFVW